MSQTSRTSGELEMDHTEFGATCSEQVPTYQDRMDALEAKIAGLEAKFNHESLVDIVAEAMWSPHFANNRDGQSFAERPAYLTKPWKRSAQLAIAAMKQHVLGDTPNDGSN